MELDSIITAITPITTWRHTIVQSIDRELGGIITAVTPITAWRQSTAKDREGAW